MGIPLPHELPHLILGFPKNPTAKPQLAHEMPVAKRLRAEGGRSHLMLCQKALNVGQERRHAACISVTHHTVKGDLTDYAGWRVPCDRSHMGEMTEIERIQAAIRRVMARKEIGQKPLSIKAGLGETAVRDVLMSTTKDVKISTLSRLAIALDCTIEDLIGSESVPLAGRIGAGGTIIFEDLGSNEFVVRPPGLTGAIEALEVVGDSMYPRYSSGDIVYIRRTHDGVLREYLGEFCAIRLVTGETFLKLLAKGSLPGKFTLRSLNAPDMEDVDVEWATPILFVLPSYSRKTLFTY